MSVQDLEEKVAHLERANADLSDEVARHEKELRRLTRIVELLAGREAARESEAEGSIPLADQRPPHW